MAWSGHVVTADHIKQVCIVEVIARCIDDGAPEELAEIIDKAQSELSAVEGIRKAARFAKKLIQRLAKLDRRARQSKD